MSGMILLSRASLTVFGLISAVDRTGQTSQRYVNASSDYGRDAACFVGFLNVRAQQNGTRRTTTARYDRIGEVNFSARKLQGLKGFHSESRDEGQ